MTLQIKRKTRRRSDERIAHRMDIRNMRGLKTLGERCKFLREHKGWTQAESAAEIAKRIEAGTFQDTSVGRIERNEVNPSYQVLRAMADMYDATMDWLSCAEWAVSDERPQGGKDNYFSEVADEVAQLIDEQTEDCRQMILAAVHKTIEQYNVERRRNRGEWEKLIRAMEALAGTPLRERLLARYGIDDLGRISLKEFLEKLANGRIND